jgi:hypothetical protein
VVASAKRGVRGTLRFEIDEESESELDAVRTRTNGAGLLFSSGSMFSWGRQRVRKSSSLT